MQPRLEKLCIVSHVVHYEHDGGIYAYAPYAREIELWADLFPQILLAAPLKRETPPPDTARIARANLRIIPQLETGGDTLSSKALQLALLPVLVWQLCRAMRQAQAIHVRCPGNLGLLGALLAPLFSRYRVAKYAGQWGAFPGESWTVKLQRKVLHSAWWQAPVLVYGNWPNQPAHVIPFFTSGLTEAQMQYARQATQAKLQPHARTSPLRLLYVGRLSKAKNVAAILRALAQFGFATGQVTLTIVGEGPEETSLRQLAAQLQLDEQVVFRGGLEFEQVLDCYANADALVLISETEGWPKAITEAMAFGLVCIGSTRGLVPQILGDGRGIVIPAGDATALATQLRYLHEAPEQYLPMRKDAATWSQAYSLESFRASLRTLLIEHWKVEVAPPIELMPMNPPASSET